MKFSSSHEFSLTKSKSINLIPKTKKGKLILGAFIPLIIIALISLVIYLMKSSDAYQTSVQQLTKNALVAQYIGESIDTGFPSGSISTSNDEGNAKISYSINGTKGSGKVYVEGEKVRGKWQYETMVVVVNESDIEIDLLK